MISLKFALECKVRDDVTGTDVNRDVTKSHNPHQLMIHVGDKDGGVFLIFQSRAS